MRLADFIAQNSETILREWESFAATCGDAGRGMDRAALRDHAGVMLADIVADLRTAQTPAEQHAKSHGDAAPDGTAEDTAAEVHGVGRAVSGFTIGEMVAEYRALRAGILRLWIGSTGTLTGDDLRDLMRFNEAIDQSVAESVSRFAQELDRSREMFVAILGHDLRTPLNTILVTSQGMLATGELSASHVAMTARIVRSVRRMTGMAEDLLDFARSRLGAGIPIHRARTDLAEVARQSIEEICIAHPSHPVQLDASGPLVGDWDSARLRQMLSNLLGNAVQYSAKDSLIRVTVSGTPERAVLIVHNSGAPIPPDELPELFDPFTRGVDRKNLQNDTGLGLGLYIAQQVARAHFGDIDVDSTAADGTTFTVALPRDVG